MQRIVLCIALLGVSSSLLAAAPDTEGDACISLSPQRQVVYHGGQHLLVRDQDRHYRVSFAGGRCGAIPAASRIKLHSNGEADVLCRHRGRVSAQSGSCRIAEVEEIDGESFASQARLRR